MDFNGSAGLEELLVDAANRGRAGDAAKIIVGVLKIALGSGESDGRSINESNAVRVRECA